MGARFEKLRTHTDGNYMPAEKLHGSWSQHTKDRTHKDAYYMCTEKIHGSWTQHTKDRTHNDGYYICPQKNYMDPGYSTSKTDYMELHVGGVQPCMQCECLMTVSICDPGKSPTLVIPIKPL